MASLHDAELVRDVIAEALTGSVISVGVVSDGARDYGVGVTSLVRQFDLPDIPEHLRHVPIRVRLTSSPARFLSAD